MSHGINQNALKRSVAKFGGTIQTTAEGYVANFYDPKQDDCGIILRFPDPRFDTPTVDFDNYIENALQRIRGDHGR